MKSFPATTIPTAQPARLTHPDGSPVRALVVDDEVVAHRSARDGPALRGLGREDRRRRQHALTSPASSSPTSIVLDVMLPDLDGLAVLARLRADGNDTPVLFLTAKDSLDDRIVGLTAGGDDYVTKPFSLEELVPACAASSAALAVVISDAATPCCASATSCSTKTATR